MPKFLADENVPGDAVGVARQAGHDLAWIKELSPGADDDAVLALSLADGRILVTFARNAIPSHRKHEARLRITHVPTSDGLDTVTGSLRIKPIGSRLFLVSRCIRRRQGRR
jgi:Domain of unknown function (DUF5615)